MHQSETRSILEYSALIFQRLEYFIAVVFVKHTVVTMK